MFEEFNKIFCYVDVSQENDFFSDRKKIHKALSKEISRYFNKYKIDFAILELGSLGGGAETFWQALVWAWNNQNIIGVITFLGGVFIGLPSKIEHALKKYLDSKKPIIFLSLGIESDKDYSDSEIQILNRFAPKRLEKLKVLSDDLIDHLSKYYSIYRFNQEVGITIRSRSFWIDYQMNHNKRNIVNNFRLNRLFRAFKISDNHFSIISFAKFGLIKREDRHAESIGGRGRMSDKIENYYLMFSTRLIKDLFNKS